jgi:hypothetical protein
MPNGDTFRVPAIREWMAPLVASGRWVDPFVRNSVFKDTRPTRCTTAWAAR